MIASHRSLTASLAAIGSIAIAATTALTVPAAVAAGHSA